MMHKFDYCERKKLITKFVWSPPDPEGYQNWADGFIVCSDYCKRCDRLLNRFVIMDILDFSFNQAETIRKKCCFCGDSLVTMIGC